MLVIDHGGGYMSLYGHNEELFRKVGELGRRGRRDRIRRRLRRPQPAGALFRGPSRQDAGRPADLAHPEVGTGSRFAPPLFPDHPIPDQVRRPGDGLGPMARTRRNSRRARRCPERHLARSLRAAAQDAAAARALDRDLRPPGRTALVQRRQRRSPTCRPCCNVRWLPKLARPGADRRRLRGAAARRADRVLLPVARRRRRDARQRRPWSAASRTASRARSRWCMACCVRPCNVSSANWPSQSSIGDLQRSLVVRDRDLELLLGAAQDGVRGRRRAPTTSRSWCRVASTISAAPSARC